VDAALSGLLPRRIRFGHSKVAVSLPKFLSKVTQGLLFRAVRLGEPHHDGTLATRSHEPHPCNSSGVHGPIQRNWSKSVTFCYPDWEMVHASILSVNTVCGSHLYCNIRSLVGKRRERVRFRQVLTPC
jgi:hypothetical protein